MHHKPDVSVIIAMYNSELWIEDAIRSILQQEPHGLDIEIMVVDDDSTDRSCEVVRKIKSDRIRLIPLSVNQGQATARNIGVMEAKGTWLQFLDSDDRIGKDLYSKFEKIMDSGDTCYLFSFIRKFTNYSIRQEITSIRDKRAFGHFGGTVCNKIIRKGVHINFHSYRYSDIIYCVEMMNNPNLHMNLIEDTYYIYDKTREQTITSNFHRLEFHRMVKVLFDKIKESDRWTRMYILEMGVAFLFDRNIPLRDSLRAAFLSVLKLYRYLPAVIFNQNRHYIKHERI